MIRCENEHIRREKQLTVTRHNQNLSGTVRHVTSPIESTVIMSTYYYYFFYQHNVNILKVTKMKIKRRSKKVNI